MRIENTFQLNLEPDEAFKQLIDVERVVPCIPGARLNATRPDGSYELSMVTRLGAMRFTYVGEGRFTEVDHQGRRAVLKGAGKEQKGQGQAEGTLELKVIGETAPVQVTTVANITLTGRAAQMGGGIIQTVASGIVSDMAREFERRSREPQGTYAEAGAGDELPQRKSDVTASRPDERTDNALSVTRVLGIFLRGFAQGIVARVASLFKRTR